MNELIINVMVEFSVRGFFCSAVPLTTWAISVVPVSCAKWPKMPKIVKPASILVNVSSVVTMVASRYTLCSKRLNDEYIIKLPKQTANEKKHCVMAAYQTYKPRPMQFNFNQIN